MIEGLEYVKETIELRKSDIMGNAFETNNLLMEDILLALGYNRKRDNGVKQVYGDYGDWEIVCNTENRFVISVFGYGADWPTDSVNNEVFNLGFKYKIITNGLKLMILSEDGVTVKIEDIYDPTADRVLNALSKHNWNPDEISAISDQNIELDDNSVIEAIKSTEVISALANKIGLDITKFADKLNNKVDELLSGVITEFKESIDSVDKDIVAELEDTKIKLDEAISRYKDLEGMLAESESSKEANTVNTGIDSANRDNTLADAIKQNAEYEVKIEQLENRLKALNEANRQSEGYSESAYREKIAELISNNQELTEKLKEATDKLDEIERKQAGEEDKKVVMARQLLEAVEDNPDLNRTYVGVVGSRLFQIQELARFAGICIQELYSEVSFDLMRLLFDGDIFKLIQPAVRGDLMINTKQYDIDISELSEDEVLTRLKTLFSKFDRVIFMCKTIGTFRDTVTNNEDYSELENIVFHKDGTAEEAEMDIFGIRMDKPVEKVEKPKIVDTSPVLGLALCDVGSILWLENSPIKNIVAVGNSDITLRIDNDTYANTLETGVISIISLVKNQYEALNNFKNTNLSEFSGLISAVKQSDESFNIPFTNYYTEIESVQKCISTLLTIASSVGLDETSVYMYFDAYEDESGELSQNYIDRESLGLNKEFDINDVIKCKDNIHCMLSGNEQFSIEGIPGVMEFEAKVIKNVVAVRTGYMTMSLRSLKEIANALITALSNIRTEDVSQTIDSLNSLVNYKKPVILREGNDIGSNAEKFNIGNDTYYIEELPGIVLAELFLNLHKLISTDSNIDLRLELDSTLYIVHRDEHITANCREYLAGKLFANITEGKIKVIVR